MLKATHLRLSTAVTTHETRSRPVTAVATSSRGFENGSRRAFVSRSAASSPSPSVAAGIQVFKDRSSACSVRNVPSLMYHSLVLDAPSLRTTSPFPNPGQFFNKGQRNRQAGRQPRDKFNSAVDDLDNPQGTDLPVRIQRGQERSLSWIAYPLGRWPTSSYKPCPIVG
ncbi:hypothetical protein MHUMG1_09038 [Metarhizium humberi]|uniref:Uncharacterized protein n=1 Tax=Metarhizium humberi TaxID=2596975 RepID=A0A9P8M489_9HYPO|nr:hypothetical protein MHUMG1_09038 [Metarhizium humberi]